MELENKYLIHVNGISCASCVRKLENLSNHNADIKTAHVYFGQSLLEVTTKIPMNPASIVKEVKKLGFAAEYLEDKAKLFDANKKSNREQMSKLAVAGFCAGNIMLSTLPIYTGVESAYKTLFAYLGFILFLPILLFSSLDFYKNALRSIKNKSLNIDLPITVALLSGFIFSTLNLIRGDLDYLYYDSTASFLFLILSTRYLLHRLQQNFTATYSDTDFGLNDSYALQTSGSKQKEELIIGDELALKMSQTLPVKCRIQSDQAEWNLSLISGESYPRLFQKGMTIESGAVLVSENCKLEVLEEYKSSRILNFQNKLEDIKKTKSEFVHFTDRFSHYFIFAVFAIATIFGAVYSRYDAFQAFQRALALIIVACPCALALGTPLAYLLGVYRAKTEGILIYKKDIFDRLLEVKNIFFDKTGTLTYGVLSVQQVEPYDPFFLNVILNLESVSQHPIAFALRKKFLHLYYDLGMNPHEIPGSGIVGQHNGNVYRFLKNISSERISSVLYKDNIAIMTVYFEDSLRPDTAEQLSRLKKLNKIFLLTGDSETVARRIAQECRLDNVITDQSPEMKKQIVEKHRPALMVGDGLNDALALQSAHVGISVQGSVQLSADNSDAYLLKSGIGQILVLLKLSSAVRSTVYSNLAISLLYNGIAGYGALAGWINPLVAAVLMPISSVCILLNTLRGVR